MFIVRCECYVNVLERQCNPNVVKEQIVFWSLLFRDEIAFFVIFLYVQGLPTVHQFTFRHAFTSSIMCSCVPYSCLLPRICRAYAD